MVFDMSPKPVEELVKEKATEPPTCGISSRSWRSRGRSG